MNTPDPYNKWDSGFYDYVLPGSLLLWLVLVIVAEQWWGRG